MDAPRTSESGQTAAEYAILVSAVTITVLGALSLLSQSILVRMGHLGQLLLG